MRWSTTSVNLLLIRKIFHRSQKLLARCGKIRPVAWGADEGGNSLIWLGAPLSVSPLFWLPWATHSFYWCNINTVPVASRFLSVGPSAPALPLSLCCCFLSLVPPLIDLHPHPSPSFLFRHNSHFKPWCVLLLSCPGFSPLVHGLTSPLLGWPIFSGGSSTRVYRVQSPPCFWVSVTGWEKRSLPSFTFLVPQSHVCHEDNPKSFSWDGERINSF